MGGLQELSTGEWKAYAYSEDGVPVTILMPSREAAISSLREAIFDYLDDYPWMDNVLPEG
jgi:hypothetical protein